MYSYKQSLLFINITWVDGEDDILNISLQDMVKKYIEAVIVVKLNFDESLHVLDYSHIKKHCRDMTMTLREYIAGVPPMYCALSEEPKLEGISYTELNADVMTRDAYDLVVQGEQPFLIHQGQIHRPIIKDGKGRYSDLMFIADQAGCYDFGMFTSPWNHTIYDLKDVDLHVKDEVGLEITLQKVVDINRSILVFGNSVVHMNEFFTDAGNVFRCMLDDHMLIDVYLNNSDIIPPSSVGLNSNSISYADLTSAAVLKNILTHPAVFIVSYDSELPMSFERFSIINREIDFKYTAPIITNNRVSNDILDYWLERIYAFIKPVREYNYLYKESNTRILLSSDGEPVEARSDVYQFEAPTLIKIE